MFPLTIVGKCRPSIWMAGILARTPEENLSKARRECISEWSSPLFLT